MENGSGEPIAGCCAWSSLPENNRGTPSEYLLNVNRAKRPNTTALSSQKQPVLFSETPPPSKNDPPHP